MLKTMIAKKVSLLTITLIATCSTSGNYRPTSKLEQLIRDLLFVGNTVFAASSKNLAAYNILLCRGEPTFWTKPEWERQLVGVFRVGLYEREWKKKWTEKDKGSSPAITPGRVHHLLWGNWAENSVSGHLP